MRLVWCPRVTGEDREAFEGRVKASDLAEFSIKTWAPTGSVNDSESRTVYFPILYSTVSHARTASIGTDLHSERTRGAAIRRARDADIMATAQNIELRNPIAGKRAGFLAFLPIYQRGVRHDSLESRRRDFKGVIAGVFQTATLFDAILADAILPKTVGLYLYPGNDDQQVAPIFAYSKSGRERSSEPTTRAALAELPHWSAPILAGDARWDLGVVPDLSKSIDYYGSWLVVGVIGLIFAAMLAYMWS